MVGPHRDASATAVLIVGREVAVEDRYALCGFDIDEGYMVVDIARDALLADAPPEAGDAHVSPVDVKALAPLFVLVARNVDTINAIAVVVDALSLELVVAPHSGLQVVLIDTKTEAVAPVILPVAFVERVVGAYIGTVSVGLHTAIELAGISADGVKP